MTVNISKPPGIYARKKARRLTLQGIYQWQVTGSSPEEIESWLIENYSSKRLDQDYLRRALVEIPLNREMIDQTFASFLDRPIEQLELVELAILRVAVYELLYLKEIPYRVVINEALEIAKSFGSIEGFKYVNGVLDKVARTLGHERI